MQGDQYSIPIVLKGLDSNGQAICIEPNMVTDIEFMIGQLRQEYPGIVSYSDGVYLFPLTQEQTFRFSGHPQPVQVRVRFNDGTVIGQSWTRTVEITESRSKVVLGNE